MKKGDDLKERTKHFALRIIRLFGSLPITPEGQVLGKQLLRENVRVKVFLSSKSRRCVQELLSL